MSKSSIKLRIQKLDDQPFQYDRFNQSIFDRFEEQAPSGNYEMTLKRKLPEKSRKQLGVVFGLVIDQTIEAFNDLGYDTSYVIQSKKPTGIEVSPELLKEYLYLVCPIFDEEDGSRVTLSGMDVLQAKQFIDSVRAYIASQWGINIPDPDPNWKARK